MSRLVNKVAFITGAGSGIGRAQALRFAQEGAAVIVTDLRGDAAQAVAREIEAAGGQAIAVAVDVTDSASVGAAVDAGIKAHARIDILCNTAGAFDHYLPSLDASRELWDRILALNLTSLYTVTNAVLPHMLARGKGVVLNMASAAGLRGGGGGAAYTSTKHAAIGYTRQLAADYGRKGIRVNAIAPGLIDTPMVADFSQDAATQATLASKPAGRLGRVEDVASASLFLVSDEADFIHAVTLAVDGGLSDTF